MTLQLKFTSEEHLIELTFNREEIDIKNITSIEEYLSSCTTLEIEYTDGLYVVNYAPYRISFNCVKNLENYKIDIIKIKTNVLNYPEIKYPLTMKKLSIKLDIDRNCIRLGGKKSSSKTIINYNFTNHLHLEKFEMAFSKSLLSIDYFMNIDCNKFLEVLNKNDGEFYDVKLGEKTSSKLLSKQIMLPYGCFEQYTIIDDMYLINELLGTQGMFGIKN